MARVIRRIVGPPPIEETAASPDRVAARDRDTMTVLHAGRHYSMGQIGDSFIVWEHRHPRDPVAVLGPDGRPEAYRLFRTLESAARQRWGYRRSRTVRWVRRLTGATVVLAISGAIVGLIVFGPDARDRLAGTTGDEPVGVQEVASRYEDPVGGYSVVVPAGWRITPLATGAELSDPAGDVTIAISSLPAGALDRAVAAFVESSTAGWSDLSLEPPREVAELGLPGTSLGGTAVDASGTSVRFLAIVLEGPERHHGLMVQVPPDWDAADGFAAVAEVVSSLQPV